MDSGRLLIVLGDILFEGPWTRSWITSSSNRARTWVVYRWKTWWKTSLSTSRWNIGLLFDIPCEDDQRQCMMYASRDINRWKTWICRWGLLLSWDINSFKTRDKNGESDNVLVCAILVQLFGLFKRYICILINWGGTSWNVTCWCHRWYTKRDKSY